MKRTRRANLLCGPIHCNDASELIEIVVFFLLIFLVAVRIVDIADAQRDEMFVLQQQTRNHHREGEIAELLHGHRHAFLRSHHAPTQTSRRLLRTFTLQQVK